MTSTFAMPVGVYEKALPADLSWEARLSAAARAGFDFVEISVDESDRRLARLERSSQERAEIRRAIAATGVPIMTMCLSGNRKYPLGSHSPEIRQRGLEVLRRAIEFATDVGLRIVQVMGYDVFYEPSDHDTRAYFMDGLRQAVLWAAQSGVMLGLENLDTPFVESLQQGMRIVNEIDSPWLQLYPDMGNLAAAGYHPPDELRLAKGHLVGIHVKDALPKIIRGVPFETGIVPLTETFQTLAQIGFWGVLAVEIWGQMDAGGDLIASASAARNLVKRLVDSAWPESGQPGDQRVV
jgi:L-ribulose-5-phosphate 3-epimerase